MHMHVNSTIHLLGINADFFQRFIADAIRCMRGKGGGDQRRMAHFVMQCQALLQTFRRILCPRRRQTVNHNHANACTDAGIFRACGGDFREKIHVIKTCRAASNHFRNRQIAADFDKPRIDPRTFGRPNIFGQPFHQRQIIGIAAQ